MELKIRVGRASVTVPVDVVLETVAAAVLGIMAAAIALWAYGASPGRGLEILLANGLGDPAYLASRAAPLVLTAVAFALPLYAGLFNIGSEGQMYAGAFAALLVSLALPQLGPLPGLVAAAAAGALAGLLLGALRGWLGVNEVVSSIMVNWTLYYLGIYAIVEYLASPTKPYLTREVPSPARIPGGAAGVFILAVLFALVAHWLLYRTRLGYAVRVTGYSEKTSTYAGFRPPLVYSLVMLVAGAFAGLAGSLIVQGVTYSIDSEMRALYGVGFTGIAVALLARNQPALMPISGLFIADLVIGGQALERELGTPAEMADFITGVIVIALAAPEIFRIVAARLRPQRLEEEERARGVPETRGEAEAGVRG